MNLNKVFLIGRLTRDPEMKMLQSGQAVVNFGLATDRIYKDKAGSKQQETEFHNIVIFGRLAEIASQYLKKGSLVYLEGRIRTRSWQDSSNNKRYRTEVLIQTMQMAPKSIAKTVPSSPSSVKPQKEIKEEEIPIIEEEEEINVEDIPF